MSVPVTSIDRFTKLKQRREALAHQLAQLTGRLDASRDRYNEIMRELQVYGIGSIDELQTKITEMNQQITNGLDQAETLISQTEAELRAIDHQEVSSPAAN